jgi:hypothetical protein
MRVSMQRPKKRLGVFLDPPLRMHLLPVIWTLKMTTQGLDHPNIQKMSQNLVLEVVVDMMKAEAGEEIVKVVVVAEDGQRVVVVEVVSIVTMKIED